MSALLRICSFAFAFGLAQLAFACDGPCASPQPVCYQRTCVADDSQPSWIFNRSTYTHDPYTGARVAQYQRIAPVEPLDDPRAITSRYNRFQTNLRGAGGSNDTYYEVQSWGNGRGGPDAEWERVHDAWKESYLQNGYSNGPAYGGYPGYGNGYGYGNGFPGYGYPGGPGNWGPWNGSGPWMNNGPGQFHNH